MENEIKRKYVTTSVSIDADVIRCAKQEAKKIRGGFSAFVENALRIALKRAGIEVKPVEDAFL